MGYAISGVICVIVLCKMKLMVVEKKFIFATLVMVIFFEIWRVFVNSNYIVGTLFASITSMLFLILYRNNIKLFINKFRKEN